MRPLQSGDSLFPVLEAAMQAAAVAFPLKLQQDSSRRSVLANPPPHVARGEASCDSAAASAEDSWHADPSDPLIRQLGLCLQVAQQAARSNAVVVQHVAWALRAQIEVVRSGGGPALAPIQGRLAPWQERRAKQLLESHLTDGISLAEVAAECRLSVGHFTRAFRRSTGTSPHRWIIGRRLDRAVALLANSTLALADVALMCGFSDQSHFTRLFARNLGMTPGTWRRINMLDPSST